MSARQEGAMAAKGGVTKDKCPYNRDSEKGKEWLAGWDRGYLMWVKPAKESDERKGRHRPRY